MKMTVEINGNSETWDVNPAETLLDALRSHGYRGAKRVCESGECGACAVIVNGLAVDSCIQLAVQSDGATIVTVEGLEGEDELHPVQATFAANGSIQCGFCIPGMIVTAANFLAQHPSPTEEDIRHALVGNLCRCTGYKKPIEAVLAAARQEGELR